MIRHANLIRGFGLVLIAHCLVLAGCGGNTKFASNISVEKLEKLSHLVSLKVHVADVLRAESGRISGAWLIKGDALIAVDMGKAEIPTQDSTSRTATILLPQPEVMQPRVDHSRTVTYDVKTGLFSSGRAESRIRDDAMKQAQILVETAARSEENLQLAREGTEKLLIAFFEQLDWRVKIEWK